MQIGAINLLFEEKKHKTREISMKETKSQMEATILSSSVQLNWEIGKLNKV